MIVNKIKERVIQKGKTMPYVVRNTFSPQYDVTRNWSAWIGGNWDSIEKAYEDIADDNGDLFRLAERYPDLDEDEIVEMLLEKDAYDVRWNEAYQKYQHVHHDGLSCWKLEAESETEAITEAQNGVFEWHGFGESTCGNIRLVRHIKDNLYLYECDDTTPEIE
jgi:hypothetical protein